MKSDEIILNYHDAVLRRSDLQILQGPFFLNDRLIDFYFAYLSNTVASDRFLFVPSSLSFFLAHCSDAASALAPLDLASKDLVFFAVNDNDDLSALEGGSHWSLLVYRRDLDLFVHHDSLAVANAPSAERLYRAVRGLVGGGGGGGRLVEGFTPRQRNGFDCGVYVLAVAKVVCDWFVDGGLREGDWFGDLKREVNAEAVEKMRGDLLKLILTLMEQKP